MVAVMVRKEQPNVQKRKKPLPKTMTEGSSRTAENDVGRVPE